MTEKKKVSALRVFLIILLSFIGLCLIAFIAFYLYADAIRFDHVDGNVMIYIDESKWEYYEKLYDMGYGAHYPIFGNSMTISPGGSRGFPFGAGESSYKVYLAVSDPLYEYIEKIAMKYDNCIKTEYDVENEDGLLTVNFHITVYPDGLDGETEQIEKSFVFDIRNAGMSNMPRLISEEYVRRYFSYYIEDYPEGII